MNRFAKDEGAQQAVTEIPSLLQRKEMLQHTSHCGTITGNSQGEKGVKVSYQEHSILAGTHLSRYGYCTVLRSSRGVFKCRIGNYSSAQQGEQEQLFRLTWLNVSPFKKVRNFWPKVFLAPL